MHTLKTHFRNVLVTYSQFHITLVKKMATAMIRLRYGSHSYVQRSKLNNTTGKAIRNIYAVTETVLNLLLVITDIPKIKAYSL